VKGQKLFKKIKKGLANTVEEVLSLEVALQEDSGVLAYTHIALDADTVSFLSDNLEAKQIDLVEFHRRMILLSRLNKGAYMELIDEIS